MYMTYHTFPVMPIKHLLNQDGEPNTPHKLATVTKPSIKIHVFYSILKTTVHVNTKALNMHHQSQKRFCGIFV